LLSFLFDFSLLEVDLFNVEIVLQLEEHLHIVSFQFQDTFVLVVRQNQHFVLLSFHLLLEIHIVVGGVRQAHSQVTRDDHVHDVHLLDDHAVRGELNSKVLHQGRGKFSLDISDSVDLNLLQEISDSFVTLFLKQLLESIGSEVINELSNILLFGFWSTPDVEVDSDINGHSYVILSWDISDGALEPDSVFGDHYFYHLIAHVAAFEAGIHDTSILTARCLKSEDTRGDIYFVVAAAGLISYDDHEWDSIRMSSRNEPWGFFWVRSVDLNQVSSIFETALDIIDQVILSILGKHGKSVSLIILLLSVLLLSVLLLAVHVGRHVVLLLGVHFVKIKLNYKNPL